MNDAAVFSELWVPPPAVAEHMEQQPECRLLWAVLVDGIETYMKYAFAPGGAASGCFAKPRNGSCTMTRRGCAAL